MLLIILLTVSAVSCLPVRESLCHPDNEFACKNGSCIPAEWRCDNVPDCSNGEDETGCDYLHHCLKDFFMCKTGECLPKEVKCNGHYDCSDNSDERDCEPRAPLLRITHSSSPSLCHPDNEFACKNGSCIPAEWRCDNVPDCSNGEDENECHFLHDCPKDLFMCRSGDCMPKEVKCDGNIDCHDGSDENGCKPMGITHSSSPSLCHPDNEFTCKNGTCIPAEWRCDNVPDCSNGEDETGCHYLHDCPKDLFMCRSGDCMPKEVKCDGHFDCHDGSDENGCLSNSTMESTTKNESIMDDEHTTFWIYIILIVLALTLMSLIGLLLKYWFFTPRRPAADETKVQFLVVEDDGSCTAY